MTVKTNLAKLGKLPRAPKTFLAIDLKSFYASVECVARGLNTLEANLVVADESRTDKTVCLAVTPSLKAYGIGGRARLFEAKERVRQINAERLAHLGANAQFAGKSYHDPDLKDPRLALDFLIAPPRMAKYIEISAQIYAIYLDFVAPEDIFVYSIDEVFIDATPYLKIYQTDGPGLATRMIARIEQETGITATAGVGTNLYLAKVAMDILAKHAEPNAEGVRLAVLDERTYRQRLWSHTPVTDFWRVGPGYQRRLQRLGLETMGDICLASRTAYGEERLYRAFGVNAELLIDHAWGWEPTEMADVKKYRPRENSLSSGQVLSRPYSYQEAATVAKEMAEALALKLVAGQLTTDQLVLTVGHDRVSTPNYRGAVTVDRYGRRVPRSAHGTGNLAGFTNSTHQLVALVGDLFERLVDPQLLVRRLNLVANHVVSEETARRQSPVRQLTLFSAADQGSSKASARLRNFDLKQRIERERSLQQAELEIKAKFGKNAILKGTNFEPGATMRQRNQQIGGHRA